MPDSSIHKTMSHGRSQVLLTTKIRHYIACFFQLGYFCAGHPFKWNRAKNQMEEGGIVHQRLWSFNMIVACTYTAFVDCRCLLMDIDAEKSNAEKIYMRLMAAYMSLALVFHVNVIMHQKLIPAFANQYHQLALLLERKYVKPNAKVPGLVSLTGWTLQATYFACQSVSVLMTINALIRPMSPEQPASLLASEPTIPVRIGSACFMFYIECLYHSSAFVIAAVHFPACSLFLTLLSEMSHHTCRITVDILRRSAKIKFQLYQLLRMEIQLLNIIFQIEHVGMKIFSIFLVVYGAYGGIRMEGFESIAMGVLSVVVTFLLFVVFGYLAEFHFRSTRLLREWKAQLRHHKSPQWVTKYIKSLTPTKITIGSCYFVDREVLLTLASILAVNTANILMLDK